MDTTPSNHPLRIWRRGAQISAESFVGLLAERGYVLTPRYISEAIEGAYRHPAFEVCEAIQEITDGAVTVAMLRHWPLRDATPSKKRAA